MSSFRFSRRPRNTLMSAFLLSYFPTFLLRQPTLFNSKRSTSSFGRQFGRLIFFLILTSCAPVGAQVAEPERRSYFHSKKLK